MDMHDVCKKHRANPARGYSPCPGCEVDQLRAKVADLEALVTAENQRKQQLADALKPFSDAFETTGVQSYGGADEQFSAFLDRNEITPAHGLTMRQFREAWERLTGESAMTPNGDANKRQQQ